MQSSTDAQLSRPEAHGVAKRKVEELVTGCIMCAGPRACFDLRDATLTAANIAMPTIPREKSTRASSPPDGHRLLARKHRPLGQCSVRRAFYEYAILKSLPVSAV